MTFYLNKANGLLTSGAFWSFGMVTSGSVSEGAANTAWGAAVNGFFATTAVGLLYHTGVELTSATTSTASAQFKQTTITRTNYTTQGTATTQSLPDQVAMVVTLRTANATKYGRGRMFFPAPVAAALSMGPGPQISSGSMTTLSTAISAMLTALVTAGVSPVLVSRRASVGGRPAYSTAAVTGADMPNHLVIQKRRGDKLVPVRTTLTL